MNRYSKVVLSFALCTAVVSPAAAQSSGANGNSPAPGDYQIRNVKHDLLLRPEDAKKADGTPIVLYPATNWKCLVWKLDPGETSIYRPLNLFTGKTFAAKPQDSSTTAVVQVAVPQNTGAQPKWTFLKGNDGYYRVSDKESGQALTATATKNDDVEIVLTPWNGKEEQKWELLPAPSKLDM